MPVLSPALTRMPKDALARWFAKRAPRSDEMRLSLRNVYIFFSKEGMLFALLLLITFVAGVNYGNNLVLGLCFYLVSIWLIGFHITFAHVSGLQVRLLELSSAEVGAPVWATIEVSSRSSKPRRQLRFVFEDHSEDAKATSGSKAAHAMVLASVDTAQTIRLPIMTHKRGELTLPRLHISTVYPLGIMRAWSYVYFARRAWVTPRPLAFDWQETAQRVSGHDETVGGQYVAGQDDFERLDDYVLGESLARVSWAHVARGQGMFTKHFADPVGHEQALHYVQMPSMHHEDKLSELAYAVTMLGRLGVPFQMHLPQAQADNHTVGQGEAFVQACLIRLAKAP
ncbi:DUF58 domain-containing protein [Psychrobacter aestuarii]|uniref:DUF58 domain-containing protein n=1 Tax=Psychrobacter aestuarii TaxID=556327 RepID=A0ABN0VLP1_9GAMM|nr:DUF58 domain-containing protein [Psychrobacter aestuarii]